MYRVVVACVGLLALAGGSVAEAQPAPYYQPGPAYNPIYSWTGFYVGINGGGGWGSSQWDAVNSFNGWVERGDINATLARFPGGSNSNDGWTVGAGVEVVVVSQVSLKAEDLY